MFKLRKRISDILIETDLINQQQLDQALIIQKNKNKRLGKILVELGYITERQIKVPQQYIEKTERAATPKEGFPRDDLPEKDPYGWH